MLLSFVSASQAQSSRLAFVDSSTNHAIVKVDNTSMVPFNEKRNTVRISTKDRYAVGSVWVADMVHVPFGVRFTAAHPLRIHSIFNSALYGLRGGLSHPIGQQAGMWLKSIISFVDTPDNSFHFI